MLYEVITSFVYANALKGGWHIPFIADESVWYGIGKKLTPPYPQKPEALREWFEANGYEIKVQTGIRVFHDYMQKEVLGETALDELMKLEYRYGSRITSYNVCYTKLLRHHAARGAAFRAWRDVRVDRRGHRLAGRQGL